MEPLNNSFQNSLEIDMQSSQFPYGNLQEFLSKSIGFCFGESLANFHMEIVRESFQNQKSLEISGPIPHGELKHSFQNQYELIGQEQFLVNFHMKSFKEFLSESMENSTWNP